MHLYAIINNKLQTLGELTHRVDDKLLTCEYNHIRNKVDCVSIYTVGSNPANTLYAELGKHNILGAMDCLFLELQSKLVDDPQHKLYEQYRNNQIIIPVVKRQIDMCDTCDRKMISITNKSKLLCEKCGSEKNLISTFSYEHASTNLNTSTRPKDYSTVKQCQKWLHLLQGRGEMNIPDEDYARIRDYVKSYCIRAGNIALGIVRQIKCEQMRKWLKLCKLTKYNKHIPLLRRRITRELGAEVMPPQFTFEEEKKILADWQRISPTYSRIYKEMKNQKKNNSTNIPYYPICILCIVKSNWESDPRVELLTDCVHKQSRNTMRMRLKCWKQTCKELGYKPGL